MKYISLQMLVLLLPWQIRRLLLQAFFGWKISPRAKIGLSILVAARVNMAADARIGHLNIVKGLSSIDLGEAALIGNLNWITANPASGLRHFLEDTNRYPSLVVGNQAAITHRHLIDCTDRVEIGEFSTFGGWRSQILTHSIDVRMGRQSAAPVSIGKYCFVGTGVVFLKGSILPDHSVLGAGSVLAKPMTETYRLYSGVPATPVSELDEDSKYFKRDVGFVD
jgi:acetyltransferase-like isoleucine patch superfamily enzyme